MYIYVYILARHPVFLHDVADVLLHLHLEHAVRLASAANKITLSNILKT